MQGGPPTQPLTAEGDMASTLAAGGASKQDLNKAIQYNHIFIQWSTHIQCHSTTIHTFKLIKMY